MIGNVGVTITDKNPSDVHVTSPMIEKEPEQKELITKFEPEDVHEVNGSTKRDAEHVEGNSDAGQSTDGAILEHTFTEEVVETNLNSEASEMDMEKLQETCELDSKEQLTSKEAGKNTGEATQKKEETCDNTSNEIPTKTLADDDVISVAETSVMVKSTDYPREEVVKQNFEAESIVKAEPAVSGGDENNKAEETEERNTIKTNEVKDGPKITSTGEATYEQIIKNPFPEVIEEDSVQSSQDTENKAEKCEGEDTKKQIIEERNIEKLSQEVVGEVPANKFQDDVKEVERSEGQIFEGVKTVGTSERIATETSDTVESPEDIADTSIVEQEESLQSERNNPTSTEASTEKKRDEISSEIASKTKEHIIEERNIENLSQEVVGEVPANKFQDDGKEAERSEGQIFEGFKTVGTSERIATKKSDTVESPEDIADTSIVEQEESLKSERNNPTPTEASTEKKRDEIYSEITSKTKEHIIEERNIENLSQEVVGEVPANKFQDDGKEAERSEGQIFEGFKTGGTSKRIATKTSDTVESPEDIADPSIVEQEESLQSERNKSIPTEASTEDKRDEISSEIASETKEHIIEERNIENLSQEVVGEVPANKFQDDGKEVERSEGQIFEGFEITGTSERIATETSDIVESPQDIADTSIVEQEESLQSERNNPTPTEEKRDEISSEIASEQSGSYTELVQVEKAEQGDADIKQVLQKIEAGEVLDGSLVKHKEGFQSEGKFISPTEASQELKTDDNEYPVKMTGDTGGDVEPAENAGYAENFEDNANQNLQKSAAEEILDTSSAKQEEIFPDDNKKQNLTEASPNEERNEDFVIGAARMRGHTDIVEARGKEKDELEETVAATPNADDIAIASPDEARNDYFYVGAAENSGHTDTGETKGEVEKEEDFEETVAATSNADDIERAIHKLEQIAGTEKKDEEIKDNNDTEDNTTVKDREIVVKTSNAMEIVDSIISQPEPIIPKMESETSNVECNTDSIEKLDDKVVKFSKEKEMKIETEEENEGFKIASKSEKTETHILNIESSISNTTPEILGKETIKSFEGDENEKHVPKVEVYQELQKTSVEEVDGNQNLEQIKTIEDHSTILDGVEKMEESSKEDKESAMMPPQEECEIIQVENIEKQNIEEGNTPGDKEHWRAEPEQAVQDGPNIKGTGETTNEQITEANITCLSPELIDNKAEKSEGEGSKEESNVSLRDLSPEVIGAGEPAVIASEEQCQREMAKHEDSPETSLLLPNEPGNENLETSSTIVSEDIHTASSSTYTETITCVSEETPIKILEGSFEEKGKEDTPIQNDASRENGIPKEKNLPPFESNEMIGHVEVMITNKIPSDVHVTNPLIEKEAEQKECKNMDIISNFEPEDAHEVNGSTKQEAKHVEDNSDAGQSTDGAILEHKFTEGVVKNNSTSETSEMDMEKLQETCELDSEENLTSKESGKNMGEAIQNKEETCDTESNEIPTKTLADDEAVISVIEASVMVKSTDYPIEEVVKQNLGAESVVKAKPAVRGESERNESEETEERNTITTEEVKDGPKSTATRETTNEQIIKSTLPEVIEEDSVQSSKDTESKAEKCEGEDTKEQIIEERNIETLSQEVIGEVTANKFQEDGKEAARSGQIFEGFGTAGTSENIATEPSHTVERPESIADPSIVEQEESLQSERDNPTPTEDSPKEKRDQISSEIAGEQNRTYTELVQVKENVEEGEADTKQILQKIETGEVLDGSLVKHKEGFQSEGKIISPTEASQEMKTDDRASPVKITGRDAELVENAGNAEIFEEDAKKILQKSAAEEILDTSSAKQEEILQDESKNQNLTEASPEEERHEDFFIGAVANSGHTDTIEAKGEVVKDDDDFEETVAATQNADDIERDIYKPEQTLGKEKKDEGIKDNNDMDDSITANVEIFKGSRTAGTSENIATEPSHIVERPESITDTSIVEQEESLQSERDNPTPAEASPEEKRDEISSEIAGEQNSSYTELVHVKENVEGEADTKQILQKIETGVLDSSLVKHKEAFQSEGKIISPTEASQDMKTDDRASPIKMTEETGRDAELAENAGNAEIFEDAKQILQKSAAEEILDASSAKQEEILPDESKNQNLTEASPEDKRNDDFFIGSAGNSGHTDTTEAKGGVEKDEDDFEETLAATPNADDIERDIYKLEQTLGKEKKDEGLKDNNDREDTITAKDIKIVVETSNAMESVDSLVLEPEPIIGNMDYIEKLEGKDVQTNIEKEIKKETEECEGSNIGSKSEKTETHILHEECSVPDITPEIIGEETIKSFEGDENEKNEPTVEVYQELQTTSVEEDDVNQVLKEIKTIGDRSTIPDGVEKIKKSYKEDKESAMMHKQDCEIIQTESIEKQNIENGNIAEDKEHWRAEPEQEVYKESETEALTTSIQKGYLETEAGLPLVEGTVKESLNEDESDVVQLPQEVDDSNSALIEKTEATGSAEEKTSGAVKEPKNEPRASDLIRSREGDVNLVGNSLVSEISEKDITEGFSTTRSTTIDDFDWSYVMVETEETSNKEAEPEDKMQVESSDLAPRERDLGSTETEGTLLDRVDISGNPENSSKLGENVDEKIPAATDEAGQKTEHEIQDEVPDAGTEGHSDALGDEQKEKYKTPSDEHTAARFQAPYENIEDLIITQATDKTMQNEDKSTDSIDDSELSYVDVHPELGTDQFISQSDVETLNTEEAGKVAKQINICESERLKDKESTSLGMEKEKNEKEKPIDEASKGIEILSTCADGEGVDEEQENLAKSIVDSSNEDIQVENVAVECEVGAQNCEHEIINSKDDGTPTEENVVTADPDKRLKYASELNVDNQSNETPPESYNSQIEGNSIDIQDQGEKEIKEEKETKLEPDDHNDKEQNNNETIKAVILSEEVHEVVEKANNDEITEECETTNEVKDSNPPSTEYLKAKNTDREETVKEQSEEEKAQVGESKKPADVSITPSEELKEGIKETKKCYDGIDTANGTEVTAETSLREVQLDDKLVETLNISSDEKSPETSETEEASSGLSCPLPPNDHEHTEKESGTLETPNAVKDEEIKIASGTVYESKDEETKETDETEKGPGVEKPDANEEETDEASNTLPGYTSQGVEAIVEDVITADQTPLVEKPKEQLQIPLPLDKQKHLTTTAVVKEEEGTTREVEMQVDGNPEDSYATKISKETCSQMEGPGELELKDEEIKHSSNEIHEVERGTLDEVREDTEKVSETIAKSESLDTESKAEENLGGKTNATSSTKIVENEELYKENEKASASENTIKQIIAEEEGFSKDDKEAINISNLQNQHDETTKATTPMEEESGVQTSQHEGTADPATVLEFARDVQHQEKTSHGALQKEISREAELDACIETKTHGKKDVPIVETYISQERDFEPENATRNNARVEGYEEDGEKRMADSSEKNKESTTVDSDNHTLFGLMQRSKKGTPQVGGQLTEENEPIASKEEKEVEEDQQEKTDSGPDAPVMVESSKEIDVKVAHKKSHNILSGVGSKVKHSISKVKKAITGKSSHTKPDHQNEQRNKQ
ncbi:hypothetical protein CFOL_v3_13729 [Cephalotus follicularis]|uniref:Uncharacterized protein n=1 Tax=Cephalotus follicularis TaxID=3775 RepID=A0A1Q3BQD1_CEPFO|nr:hypothetical protein CFOL_v3_13729 [Cephalotus follicularis]